MPRPIPADPPVTNATLSWSSVIVFLRVGLWRRSGSRDWWPRCPRSCRRREMSRPWRRATRRRRRAVHAWMSGARLLQPEPYPAGFVDEPLGGVGGDLAGLVG